MTELAVGDYVLATKYDDGDPGDPWALGWYHGERGGRHFVKDNAGNQIRPGGFRRVARVRKDVGRWLLEVAAQHLELAPPGTVNLWTMLTPEAFGAEDAATGLRSADERPSEGEFMRATCEALGSEMYAHLCELARSRQQER